MTYANQVLAGDAVQYAAQYKAPPSGPISKIEALLGRASGIRAELREATYAATAIADRVHGAIPVGNNDCRTSQPARAGSIGELEDAFDAITSDLTDLRMQIARLQDI